MIFEINKKGYVIIIFTVLLFAVIDIFIYKFINKEIVISEIYQNDTNTFSSNYITNDKQASIYLNIYYNLLNNDTKVAYKLVDKSSLKTFSNINEFKKYINALNISNTKVTKIRYYKNGKYQYYDIIDGNDNNIIFKTNGVMNYTVIFK